MFIKIFNHYFYHMFDECNQLHIQCNWVEVFTWLWYTLVDSPSGPFYHMAFLEYNARTLRGRTFLQRTMSVMLDSRINSPCNTQLLQTE